MSSHGISLPPTCIILVLLRWELFALQLLPGRIPLPCLAQH